MPQMGGKKGQIDPKASPGAKPNKPPKDGDLYNISHLNQQIMDEGEDAGGAIMKKLYRIHSRYILETVETLNIDISG